MRNMWSRARSLSLLEATRRPALSLVAALAAAATLIASCGREDGAPLHTEIQDLEDSLVEQEASQATPLSASPNQASVAAAGKEKPVWLQGRLWSHAHPWNVISDGSFEQWEPLTAVPPQWKTWVHAPQISLAQPTAWHGTHSIKLVGLEEGYCVFAVDGLPPVHELVGEEVVFCAWVRTDFPQRIELGIFDNVELPHLARPTTWNEWELLAVRTRVLEDAEVFEAGIGVMPNEPPASCYVDGAALYIGRDLPWPPDLPE